MLVRDTVAEHHGWKVGDVVPMTFARTGVRKLPIRGLFSTMAVRTDYVISLKTAAANYAQPLILEVDVRLAPGVAPSAGQAGVRAALADLPVAKVMNRTEVLAAQQSQIEKLLAPVAALLGLAVLIGLLGIANALALSIHERTRELGLLRAVGHGPQPTADHDPMRGGHHRRAGLGARPGTGRRVRLGRGDRHSPSRRD